MNHRPFDISAAAHFQTTIELITHKQVNFAVRHKTGAHNMLPSKIEHNCVPKIQLFIIERLRPSSLGYIDVQTYIFFYLLTKRKEAVC